MTSSSIRKHASTGPASDQPAVPEPAFAERARTLMYLGRIGSLSTLSRKQPGFPFGSVMPYGLDDHGGPFSLLGQLPCISRTFRPTLAPACLLTQMTAAAARRGPPEARWEGMFFHFRKPRGPGLAS